MDIQRIETERLILRGPTMQDAPSYQKHFVDYEVIKNLSAVPWPYPENGIKEYIANHIIPTQGKNSWIWGIFRKEAPEEMIGGVYLRREGNPGHRGFWLGREHWGKGFMTEAVIYVTDAAFNTLGFKKLVFSNAVGNTRSHRIKVKTGARLIRIEDVQYINPDYTSREVWEITQEEWYDFRAFPVKK